MDKKKSSSQTRCITLTMKENEVSLKTQLDYESTIRVLEKILIKLKERHHE